MEKPLMCSLKDCHSEIAQTTLYPFVHSFLYVVSDSLHIGRKREVSGQLSPDRSGASVRQFSLRNRMAIVLLASLRDQW